MNRFQMGLPEGAAVGGIVIETTVEPLSGQQLRLGERIRGHRRSNKGVRMINSAAERRRRSSRRGVTVDRLGRRHDSRGRLMKSREPGSVAVVSERRSARTGKFTPGPFGAAAKRTRRKSKARRTGRKVARRVTRARRAPKRAARRSTRARRTTSLLQAAKRTYGGSERRRRRARRMPAVRRIARRRRHGGREALLLTEMLAAERRRRHGRRPARGRRRTAREVVIFEAAQERRRRRMSHGRRRRGARDYGWFGEAIMPNQARSKVGEVWEVVKQGGVIALGLFGTRFVANLFQRYLPAPVTATGGLQRWWGVLGSVVAAAIAVPVSKRFPKYRAGLLGGAGVAVIQKLLEAMAVGSFLAQTGQNALIDAAKSAVTGEPLMVAGVAGLGGYGHQGNGLGVCAIGCPQAPLLGLNAQTGVDCAGNPVAVSTIGGGYSGLAGCGHPAAGVNAEGLGVCAIGCPVAPLLNLQAQNGVDCAGNPVAVSTISGGYNGLSGMQPQTMEQIVNSGLMGDNFRANPNPAAMEILNRVN